MRAIYSLVILSLFAFSCKNPNKNNNQESQSQVNNVEIYEAQIQSLNSSITNLQTSGKARFVIDEDKMHVTFDIRRKLRYVKSSWF